MKIKWSRHAALLLSFLLSASTARAVEEPLNLFNGRDFSGWSLEAPKNAELSKVCRYNKEGAVEVAGKPIGYLSTEKVYSNYRFHAEWRWPKGSGNGGVLIHIGSGPQEKQWPLSYQVETKTKSVGDVLPLAGATFAEPLTSKPKAPPALLHTGEDSERLDGEWNSCDILCLGDIIQISINGVLQNKVTGCSQKEGKIGFQLDGSPFELRNVTLRSLG